MQCTDFIHRIVIKTFDSFFAEVHLVDETPDHNTHHVETEVRLPRGMTGMVHHLVQMLHRPCWISQKFLHLACRREAVIENLMAQKAILYLLDFRDHQDLDFKVQEAHLAQVKVIFHLLGKEHEVQYQARI